MKKNGNDKNLSEYYIGLDIGTESVGWAVTDKDYNLMRSKGKDMWGVRLFDETETKQARRLNRTNRRRLARQKWRLHLLRELFDEEICRVDKNFFMRLKSSSLIGADKNADTKFILFADGDYTDKNYFTDDVTKTAYHLRKRLIEDKNPHDIRLVFLALHHIMKSRGHFLYSLSDGDDEITLSQALDNYFEEIKNTFDITVEIENTGELESLLCNDRLGKKLKFESIKPLVKISAESHIESKAFLGASVKLIVGMTVKIKDILMDGECENDSFCVTDADDKQQELFDKYEDISDILIAAKAVYDRVICEKITKGYPSFSAYKVAQYEQHKNDIKTLKEYVNEILKDRELYKQIFVYKSVKNSKGKDEGLKNYAAYSRYKKGDEFGGATSDEFCAFLKKKLVGVPEGADPKYLEMWKRIEEGSFAPKLRTSENGSIPNSLHRKELLAILNNAEAYLPFLGKKDANGLSVKDKIIAIFDYKLPYYVGPVGEKSQYGWAVRKAGMDGEKLLPWNYSEIIDESASSQGFIERMKSLCSYTGENVLARDSLLYSEFAVLNEINNLKVNGNPITVEAKKLIYERLYLQRNRKVRLKDIKDLLVAEGYIQVGDDISGADETLNATLASYHKLKRIIEKTSYDTAEKIIEHVVIFGEAKKMLKKWLHDNVPQLCEEDVKYMLSLRFKDWGRLSKVFLTEICDIDREDGTGELVSIIDMMRNHNVNLMQLLSNKYEYAKAAYEHKLQKSGVIESPKKMVEDLYVSPKIRRSIWQAVRIVDEIVDILGAKPRKIFVEVPRENDPNNKGKRTNSRKQQLIELYKTCAKQSKELSAFIDKDTFDKLYNSINSESDSNLRKNKLFLYYRQFGKCMYSMENINLNELYDDKLWDRDHIYPRSKIKDDSLDNLVLVNARLNKEKTNVYPISENIRNRMYAFWKFLLNNGCISKTKFERLTRVTELTDDELSTFINRQIVETGQSTKAVAEMLNSIYGNDKNGVKGSRIVYSKAGNVSDFRKYFDILKCREVNDLHHAHDAYLNIVVGNYFDTKFTSEFIKNVGNEDYSLKTEALYSHDVKGAWISGEQGTISTVRKVMAKNSVLYTQMALEEKGQFFDLQPVKARQGLIPLKNGLDTETYGGYDKAKGAYWALVEYKNETKKGVEIRRTIEPVLLYQKAQYERNPQGFAAKNWQGASIVIDKILNKSLLEIDGARLLISGRSKSRLILVNANQLILDYPSIKYVRSVVKYVDRYLQAKKQLDVYPADGVSASQNVILYDKLLEKSTVGVYAGVLSGLRDTLQKCRDNFITESVQEQCVALREILKAFACKAVYAKLKSIGGSSDTEGLIRISKNLPKDKNVRLIYQSVTGLYERKINLTD